MQFEIEKNVSLSYTSFKFSFLSEFLLKMRKKYIFQLSDLISFETQNACLKLNWIFCNDGLSLFLAIHNWYGYVERVEALTYVELSNWPYIHKMTP